MVRRRSFERTQLNPQKPAASISSASATTTSCARKIAQRLRQPKTNRSLLNLSANPFNLLIETAHLRHCAYDGSLKSFQSGPLLMISFIVERKHLCIRGLHPFLLLFGLITIPGLCSSVGAKDSAQCWGARPPVK